VGITPPVLKSCFQDFPKGPLFPIENTLVRPPHRAHTRQSGTETEPLNESGGNGDFNRWQSSRPVQPPARLKKLCVLLLAQSNQSENEKRRFNSANVPHGTRWTEAPATVYNIWTRPLKAWLAGRVGVVGPWAVESGFRSEEHGNNVAVVPAPRGRFGEPRVPADIDRPQWCERVAQSGASSCSLRNNKHFY